MNSAQKYKTTIHKTGINYKFSLLTNYREDIVSAMFQQKKQIVSQKETMCFSRGNKVFQY